ncbi:MAG: hypothetical protein WBF05_04095 [Anaerolineales bacterium]
MPDRESDLDNLKIYSNTSSWGRDYVAAVCEDCDWNFLILPDLPTVQCPHCYQSTLKSIPEGEMELPYSRAPELVVPFQVTLESMDDGIEKFSSKIPFAPKDMTSQNMRSRLCRLFLPMWLVDTEVQAQWWAEVGSNYKVVSHQAHYDDHRGGWSSREVEEWRIRWEPRLGRLERNYHNISTPALEEDMIIKQEMGAFKLGEAVEYQVKEIENSFVRLPNRDTKDAWVEATPAIQTAAAEECRQAAGADHIRQFSWKPQYSNNNWTLMLLPLYTTYYLDAEKVAQPVFIHGQTGQIMGVRRASMKRGQRMSLIILVIAVLIFLLSIILAVASVALPILLVIGVLGFAIALLTAAGAVVPIAMVWQFNHRQKTGRSPYFT